MMAWLMETLHAFDLAWTEVLWGLVGFLGMSIGSIALVALRLVMLPATYEASPQHACDGTHALETQRSASLQARGSR